MANVPSRVDLLRGTLDLLILRTLLPGPSHGHAIAKHIQRTSEDLLKVETGSLYPALYRLEAKSWISASWGAVRQGQARPLLPHHCQGAGTVGGGALEMGRLCSRHGAATQAGGGGWAMISFFRKVQWWLQRRRKDNELHAGIGLPSQRRAGGASGECTIPRTGPGNGPPRFRECGLDHRGHADDVDVAGIGTDRSGSSIRSARASAKSWLYPRGGAHARYGDRCRNRHVRRGGWRRLAAVAVSPIRAAGSAQPDQSVEFAGLFSDPNFDDLRATATASRRSLNTPPSPHPSWPAGFPCGLASDRFRATSSMCSGFPSQGRRFVAEELREGAAGVAVVSSRFWRQHFSDVSEPSAASLRVNGQSHTIVGIMPPGFAFPANVDIWTPREVRPQNPYRTGHNWQVVARIKDDLPIDVARAEATAVAQRLKQQYGDRTVMTDVAVIPLRDELVGQVRPVLFLLFSSVVLLMGVACANLATLFLARISTRRRELAVSDGTRGQRHLAPSPDRGRVHDYRGRWEGSSDYWSRSPAFGDPTDESC